MSNTHKSNILPVLTSSLMVAGTLLLAFGPKESTSAHMLSTGPGTYLSSSDLAIETSQPMWEKGSLHSAAMAKESITGEVVLGMLFLLLGFGLHALFVLRNQKPISSQGWSRPRITRKDLDSTTQQIEMFWKGSWRL